MRSESLEKLSKGKRIALLASVLTALLALAKFIVGTLYRSDILIADSLHSFADTVAILASAFGLYLSGKAKSARFPYGLYRAETLASLVIGIFILLAGLKLVTEGINSLSTQSMRGDIPIVPVATVLGSIIISIFIAWKEIKVAREISSMSLEANGKESILDIISSAVVMAGIIMPSFNIPYAEGIIIIGISFLIMKIGFQNTYRSMLVLMDANLNLDLKNTIRDIVINIKGIKDIKDINIRESGLFKMIDMEIMVSPSASVFQANEISETLTRTLYENFDDIEAVNISIIPAKSEIYRAVIPVEDMNGMDSKVFHHFGRSRYYAIVSIREQRNEITIEDFYLNEFLDRDKHIGLCVVKSLVDYNIDLIFTNRIGEISFYILKDNIIDIYLVESSDVSIADVVEQFLKGKLKKITKPTHGSDITPSR